MRINHNIAALNTYRQLTSASGAQSKSMEKLSSGLRINSAADDAAGLAISEKMRGQIRGLDMAAKNAQDGISLIQTAEGALNETHDILQRMRELATQSSNDTNTATDREELQKEVDQLSQELTRIGNNTEFNTQKLLNGSFEGTFHIGANENQNLKLDISDMRGSSLGVTGNVTLEVTATVTDAGDGTDDIADGSYNVAKNETSGDFELINDKGQAVATSTDGKSWTAANGDDTLTFGEAVTTGSVKISSGSATATGSVTNEGLQAGVYKYDDTAKALLDNNGDVVAVSDDATTFKDYEGNTLVTFSAAISNGDEITVRGIDISTHDNANAAITKINSAIETVSAERSKLGAYQNRLDHSINNLNTSSENLTAAESRIRDVDMAKEMMNQTKNSILAQAAQAMLAQSNQMPQGVLQLLR
ncbi:flagellin [Bacillus pakistanensis]|uniref:Flagellin n=1 Tax=Rossellomorea pakistanensis TaxID=992288 RepID=A0ABS2NDE3_9BACI|nr:flagellin [Bacillus pakistanensis]MBM7585875.1 flagellin [Bacillus pakistanensis]